MGSPEYSSSERSANKEVREKPIETDSMLLEITLKCYVGCKDCYKQESVSAKSPHLDREVVEKRLEWIKEHTSAKSVSLIGGEPLLHPNFIEIFKKAQELGLEVHIITAGQISKLEHEQKNYEFMLDQYEQGNLHIDLSYQPGRNGKAFKRTYTDILERAESKRIKLKKVIKYFERVDPEKFKGAIKMAREKIDGLALYSTVTIPSSYQGNPEKFKGIYRFLLVTAGVDFENATTGKEKKPITDYIKNKFEDFGNHFFPQGTGFADVITYKHGSKNPTNRVRARIWGPVRFERDQQGNVSGVLKSLGSEKANAVCPAMSAGLSNRLEQVTTGPLTIRTDGELTYSTPSCIASPVGLLNVDITNIDKEIFQRLRANIEAIVMANTQGMREKAELLKKGSLGFCKKDPEYPHIEGWGNICPSCPFDISCNSCFSRTTEERDEYYKAIKEVLSTMY